MEKLLQLSLLLWLAFFEALTGFGACLRISRLEVPASVAKGTAIVMNCNYDLEGDDLYSVKWYKDYVEFYRFLPSDEPRPGQKFKLKGTHVDLSGSNATHALLSKTDVDSEGTYACEVSTEGPSFSTIRAEKQMKVYVLPQESLRIEGSQPDYYMDNMINLTCMAGPSSPSASLIWYINEQKALPYQLVTYSPETRPDGLRSSRVGLFFRATPNYFDRGLLRLRCTATITLVYQFEASQTLIGGTPKNVSINSPYSWSKGGLLFQADQETPKIKNIQEKYHVGAFLDLNCTTNAHDALLKWFVKNKEANESELVRYGTSEVDGHKQLTLGLTFRMQKKHFQMQELKLRCLAIHQRPVVSYSQQLVIRTFDDSESLRIQPNSDSYGNDASSVRCLSLPQSRSLPLPLPLPPCVGAPGSLAVWVWILVQVSKRVHSFS